MNYTREHESTLDFTFVVEMKRHLEPGTRRKVVSALKMAALTQPEVRDVKPKGFDNTFLSLCPE